MLEEEIMQMGRDFCTFLQETTWQEIAIAAGVSLAGFCLYIGLWLVF